MRDPELKPELRDAMKVIRFRFAPKKACAAIQWMLDQYPRLDLHTLLKACYFADKEHLNSFHRPIFGASYKAMKFGPVPLEIYEMLKGEVLWLAELGASQYPWRADGYYISRVSNEATDLSVLSKTDIDALERGLAYSKGMTFNERTAATHGTDWQAANLGWMRYEDMLAETPEKAEIVAYLRETAPFMRL